MKYPGKVLNDPPENDPQLTWFKDAQQHEHECPNPCVRLYGPSPEKEVCKNCRLFLRKGGYANTYFKCLLRGDTNGPGTDHRANWPACKRFVKKL
jgi:hypothetical protein